MPTTESDGIGMVLWRAGIGNHGSWRVARRSSFCGPAAAISAAFRCHWPMRPSIRSRSRSAWPQRRAYSSDHADKHFAQRDGVPASHSPRMPRSGEPATNFSAKATSPRQACQASSTTAGSATAPA